MEQNFIQDEAITITILNIFEYMRSRGKFMPSKLYGTKGANIYMVINNFCLGKSVSKISKSPLFILMDMVFFYNLIEELIYVYIIMFHFYFFNKLLTFNLFIFCL